MEDDQPTGWDGVSKPKPEQFDDYDSYYEAQADWVAAKKLREHGMVSQPQSNPQEEIAALRKTLSDDDKVLFDTDQRIKGEIQGWRNELAQAEQIGDEQRYQRAEYWLRENLAEQEDLYRENPELEAQRMFRNEQGIRWHEGLLDYAMKPLQERQDPFWVREAQQLVEWQDQQSEFEFSMSVDDEGRMFRIDHPGLSSREASLEISRNQLTEQYPSHRRKLDAARNKIGIASKWHVKQITAEPGAKSKPKFKATPHPAGDLEVVSAVPGEDHRTEHLDMEEAQREYEQQKADQNKGPKPRTHLFSRMF